MTPTADPCPSCEALRRERDEARTAQLTAESDLNRAEAIIDGTWPSWREHGKLAELMAERDTLCRGWSALRRRMLTTIGQMHRVTNALKKDRLAVRVDLETKLGAERAARERAEAEVRGLAEALKKYGFHVGCASQRSYEDRECDCGLDALLAKVPT